MKSQPQNGSRNMFGTFGGVFTPAILTILGVIMFMRANFVVGQAGIIGALIILVIAKSITLSTSLSIAAISTNIQVRGGGSYFLISRVLGAEYGGSIGIALFFALALSVPFYILGFTEALVLSFGGLEPHFLKITLVSAVLLFAISFYGAGLALKTQFIIMAFLFMALAAFLGGALEQFSVSRFMENLDSSYTPLLSGERNGALYSFWIIFAIYFPAVTGIDAGVNMSGDLEDPGKSIPRGTLAAVLVGFLVYCTQIILCGGAWQRDDLVVKPFELLRDNALFGAGWIVIAGVIAATLSSALGSFLGAPRVLQAVSRDKILTFLAFFAKGSAKGDEPRRALLFTFVITISVLLWAGNESGGGALNVIAAVITMFFLYSYGMINLAAFIEDFSDNPSFRPQFRFFHWGVALFGALGCATASILINWVAALAAIIIIALLLWYIKSRQMKAAFGDARRGFVYSSIRRNLIKLDRMPDDARNWRPTVLVFAGIPASREILLSYAQWFAAKRGLVYLALILTGEFNELVPRRKGAIEQLKKFCREKDFEAFPVVAAAEEIEQGVSMLLQATSTGPIHPNVAIFGWTSEYDHVPAYLRQLTTASDLGLNLLLVSARELPEPHKDKRVDIWWRGRKNGDLMMMTAHLLCENWEWEDTRVRLLRVVENEAGREPAKAALTDLTRLARITATVEVVVSDRPFDVIFRENSSDADCVVLGFELPEPDGERTWHGFYQKLLFKMPPTILVKSQGDELLGP